jgi:hypothetical protein
MSDQPSPNADSRALDWRCPICQDWNAPDCGVCILCGFDPEDYAEDEDDS